MLGNLHTKAQLHHTIEQINQRQQANAFSSLMVQKVLGVEKTWKQLNKPELSQLLESWEQLMAKCPQTKDWKTVKTSDRLLSVTANGHRWVDYFGFASRNLAQEFATEILPDCQWLLIRKSGKRLNASMECKVWGLAADKYQSLVDREPAQSLPAMILVYDAANGGKYQTYVKSAVS